MAMLSSQMSNLLDARVSRYFYQELSTWPKEYPQWCNVMSSENSEERASGATELTMPGEVGEFEQIPEAQFVEGQSKTWTHTKYGFKVTASEELLEDQRHAVLDKTAGAVGRAMAHRIETQGAYDLNSAFTVATIPANGTDEYLIQTNHAAWTGSGGGTQSNAPSTDVTLGIDAVWAGLNSMATLKDHAGNPAMVIMEKLVIHPNEERTAVEILESDKVAYKSTNETNAVRKKGLRYVIGHYLTASAAWYLLARKSPIDFYFRRKPRVRVVNTATNESRSWIISARLSHGAFDYLGIYGSDGVA